jgi:hypothetical protein
VAGSVKGCMNASLWEAALQFRADHTYELITARSRRPNGVIGLFVRRLMMSVLLRGAWLQPEGKVGHEHPAVPGDAVSRTPGFDRLGKEEEAQALVGAIGLCLGADALAGLMSRLLRDAG